MISTSFKLIPTTVLEYLHFVLHTVFILVGAVTIEQSEQNLGMGWYMDV